MQESSDVGTVIGLIYEAACKPSLWPTALENIASYTHSTSAALLYLDNEQERAGDLYTYNISAETSAKHQACGIDPNFQIMSENVPLGTAAAIDHIIPDRNKLEKIYGDEFNKLLASADMYYLGGAILLRDDTRLAAIGLQRKKSMGGWTSSQINELNDLIPHLQNAIHIQKEFARLQSVILAFHKGLDTSLTGVILFDRELHPVYINPVARSILKHHPAIHLKNNKIAAYKQAETKSINDALVSAISASRNPEHAISSTSLGLKHPDTASTLPVIISQAHETLHGFDKEGIYAHAVMFLSDPDKAYPIDPARLEEIYGLTPAESRVAILIANGINTDQIARLNKVAISTIRSQLKSIYRKLDVKSQQEIVKLLLTGPFCQRM